MTELIEFSGRIARSIDIPVMADADDCGGSPIAVYRAIQGFERAGLAAVMIEDHVQAKRSWSAEAPFPPTVMEFRITVWSR